MRAANDQFGRSVSISGDYKIVGAYYDDDGGGNPAPPISLSAAAPPGASRPRSLPTMRPPVIISDILYPSPVIMPSWGRTMTMTGAAVPAPPISLSASGTSWSQQAKLVADDAAAEDWFGESVAIDPVIMQWWGLVMTMTRATLPAPPISLPAAAPPGASRPSSLPTMRPDMIDSESLYAISGDYVIAGAYSDDDGGSGSGSAYIFVRSGTSWSQQAKLVADDAAQNDFFGRAVCHRW